MIPTTTDVAPPVVDAALLETVLLRGDLGAMKAPERMNYYRAVCNSLGLNPLTRPFDFLNLQGKTVLYAKRECTEQLRKIHGVSVTIVDRSIVDDVYIVTARAKDKSGREDESTGAVLIGGLKGENKANAFMKAECVPLDSEILTRRGWLTYNQAEQGEEVLAYDCATDRTLWTPLEAITVHDRLPMARLFSKQFDLRCTPDHSWAVRKIGYQPDHRTDGSRGPRGPYLSRQPDRLLLPASALATSHSLILAAPNTSPVESVLTPIEAAILGWAVTDGTINKHGRIGICQSKDENFDGIRELIGAVHPGFRESVTPATQRTFPSSGRTYATKEQHWWYLPAQVSRDMLDKAGFTSRADLPALATRLDSTARRAMLQAMMLAEGDKRNVFANTDRSILDTFQILCALEGIATGQEHVKTDNCRTIRRKLTRHVARCFLTLEMLDPQPAWCPTTAYGTWVMRQNGRVTITGNTKAKRRVTLSICGLAFLDETEADSVPGVGRLMVDMETGEIVGQDGGSKEASDQVAAAKIQQLQGPVAEEHGGQEVTPPPAEPVKPARKSKVTAEQIDFLPHYKQVKHDLFIASGKHVEYYDVLQKYGFEHANDIRDKDRARSIYKELCGRLNDLRLGITEADIQQPEKGGTD